tara:strand:+ start:1585 stop:2235 length:651 start_codon:yes stop_codon:yes gene_type:complete
MKKKNKTKYSKKAKGRAETFRTNKVIIEQLKQINIPKDIRTHTLKHFSASVIQDRFNEKYFKRVKQYLNGMPIQNLEVLKQSYDYFIDSVNTSYQFDKKNIPSIILDIKPNVKKGQIAAKFLIDLRKNENKLKQLFKKVGYNNIITIIDTMTEDLQHALVSMKIFREFAINDYKASQLGLESKPVIRNTSTRRTDMVSRPPKTVRTRAITRRVRSR